MMRRGMIRAIVSSVTAAAGKLARFTAGGRSGETITDREVLQQYGFQSRPKDGAEALIIREGEHYLMIASDDRRYRIGLQDGEVALATDEGDTIHLKRGSQIHIETSNVVRIGNKATIDTATGVVTQQCVCALTGATHPVYSGSVKATLL